MGLGGLGEGRTCKMSRSRKVGEIARTGLGGSTGVVPYTRRPRCSRPTSTSQFLPDVLHLIPLRQARPPHVVICTNEHERRHANEQASNDGVPRPTKISFLFARTPTTFPHLTLGAMYEWVMFVSDLLEEVDFVFVREECRGDRVNGCVTPALSTHKSRLEPVRIEE